MATISNMEFTSMEANRTMAACPVRLSASLITKDNDTATSECKEASSEDYCEIC